jgi:hypothetical protein
MDELRIPAQVTHITLCNNIVKEIENLECCYNANVQAGGSKIIPQNLTEHFGSKSVAPYVNSSSGCYDDGASLFSETSVIAEDLGSRRVPPDSVNKDDDYHSSVLKKDGYL